MDRALLIGINAYPSQPLNGCVNDVTDMAAFVSSQCSFDPANIRLVVDARATTDAIRDRINWLLTGLSAGDRVLLHYSGHGVQLPLRNAQGVVSQQQDAICPVDFDWSRDHAITASDFQTLFQGVPPGIEFIFLSDSCYSGGLVRALERGQVKTMQPPADIAWRHYAVKTNKIAPKTLKSIFASSTNCGFISGCGVDQESIDTVVNGRPNGAFTYYLLQTLSTGGLGKPLIQMIPDLVGNLKNNGYSQIPELHGSNIIEQASFLSRSLSKSAIKLSKPLLKKQ